MLVLTLLSVCIRRVTSETFALIIYSFSRVCIILISSQFEILDILDFRRSQTTTLQNSDFLSEYTARTQLLLAGTREERTWQHLVAPRNRCSA
jgi:hypothetical protein